MAYQIPLYVCFPIPAFLVLTLPFLPESPRWLLHHNRPEEALKSLRFFRKGAYDEVAVQQEFEEMRMIAAREAESQKDWRLMLELFRGPNLRRTIVSVGVTSANAGVGAMFILSFGTYFLKIVSSNRRKPTALDWLTGLTKRQIIGQSRRPVHVDRHHQLRRTGWPIAFLVPDRTSGASSAHSGKLPYLQLLHARHRSRLHSTKPLNTPGRYRSYCGHGLLPVRLQLWP